MDAECALPLFFLSKLTPRKPVCPPLNQRKVFLAKYLPLLFLSSPASHHLLSYAPLSNLHPQPPSWACYWWITARPCMELHGRCPPPPPCSWLLQPWLATWLHESPPPLKKYILYIKREQAPNGGLYGGINLIVSWVGVILELFHAIFLLMILFLELFKLDWTGQVVVWSMLFNSCSFSSGFISSTVWKWWVHSQTFSTNKLYKAMDGGAGYLW